MVLAKESHQRFFLSWRGRCLLVSTANIRVASQLEGGDHLQRLKESEELEDNWQRGTKHYEDMSGAPEPIEEGEPQEALGWEAHDGVLAPKPGGRPKNRAKEEIAKTLKGMKTIKTIQKQRRKKEDRLDLRTASASKGREGMKIEEEKKKAGEEDQATHKDDEEHQTKMQQIRDQMNQWLGQPQEEGFQGRLRQHLLDDVPQQFKKRSHEEEPGTMTEEQLVKRFRPSFFSYIMVASVEKDLKRRANQWATKEEIQKLRILLDLPITSARYHFGARKRLQDPKHQKGKARYTVMLGEKEGTALVTQETAEEAKARPKRKALFLWRGMSLFVSQPRKPTPKEGQEAFVELPSGLYQVLVTDLHQWHQLVEEEENQQAFFEAFLLQMKEGARSTVLRCRRTTGLRSLRQKGVGIMGQE